MSDNDYSGFTAGSKKIISELESLGWTFEVKAQAAYGKAPDGETTGIVGRTLKADDQKAAQALVRSWRRKIAAAIAAKDEPLSRWVESDLARITDGWHGQWQSAVAAAAAFGWTGEQMVNGALRLRSPMPGHRPVVIRQAQGASKPTAQAFESVRSRIVAGARPDLLDVVSRQKGSGEFSSFAMTAMTDATVAPVATKAAKPARPQPVDAPVDAPLPTVGSDETFGLDESLGAQPVSVRPFLARVGSDRDKGMASLYESQAVNEETYADGSKRWVCTVCGWAHSENPRSVSQHYAAAHVKTGQVPASSRERPIVAKDVPVDSFREPYTQGGHHYEPSKRLLDALTAYLLDASTHDIQALAYAALQWVHKRPDLDDQEVREREPLTPEQVLDRVRALVGGRDVALEAAHEELLLRVAEVEKERDQMLSDLTGLRELVTGMTYGGTQAAP